MAELLALVGISDPVARLRQYPHELSGGMKQRVGIARALLCDPALLLADEPTTALDVTIQAQILDLLAGLRERLAMSMVLVTHDMGVVARMADRITVMYAGRICETGRRRHHLQRAAAPLHPRPAGKHAADRPQLYAARCATCCPASPAARPTCCTRRRVAAFHDRCPEAMAECRQVMPEEVTIAPGHSVSCLRRGSGA